MSRAFAYLVLITLGIVGIAPFLYLAVLSSKRRIDILAQVPPNLDFEWARISKNYTEVLFSQGMLDFTLNSLIVVGATTVLVLVIATPAAYAFSRFRFRGRQPMLRGLLLVQVFPALLALVAIFLMISQIGDVLPFVGLNTHTSLILVYLGGAMGINIWLMKGFLDTIPRDIDESAMVEGATHWQIFTRLILPLLRPILIVIGILNYIGTYGEFILARVLLKGTEQYTLMVGLQVFAGADFNQRWGVFAAGALIGALPIMIIYLVFQDQIVGGLTQGAVKG